MNEVMLFFYVISQMFLRVLLFVLAGKMNINKWQFSYIVLLFVFQIHWIYLIYSLYFSFMCIHTKTDVLLNVWITPEETAFLHFRINDNC